MWGEAVLLLPQTCAVSQHTFLSAGATQLKFALNIPARMSLTCSIVAILWHGLAHGARALGLVLVAVMELIHQVLVDGSPARQRARRRSAAWGAGCGGEVGAEGLAASGGARGTCKHDEGGCSMVRTG